MLKIWKAWIRLHKTEQQVSKREFAKKFGNRWTFARIIETIVCKCCFGWVNLFVMLSALVGKFGFEMPISETLDDFINGFQKQQEEP